MNRLPRFLFQIVLLLNLLVVSSIGWAQIKLPAIIGSNMVLQQQSNVPIWGWASKNQKVKLVASWTDEVFEVKANKLGKWVASIPTPKAGGPYSVSITAEKEIIFGINHAENKKKFD